MEFLQLKYFQHAAVSGNFSHTAEAFGVPASSVSASVKKLEGELNTRLFDRTANRAVLNEKGHVFLECTERIFGELERAKEKIIELDSNQSGKVHMLVRTNRRIVTTLISEFRRDYPQVSFVLDFDENRNYKDYDIIVTDDTIKNDAFECYHFVREEVLLAVHRDNPLSRKQNVSMEELEKQKFICLSDNYSLRTITDNLCRQACFRPDIVIECSDPYYIREYLEMNMGVSLVPSVAWANQLGPEVCLVRINEGVYRDSMVYVKNDVSAAARNFAERLEAFRQ